MRFLMDQEGMTTKDRLFIRVVNHLAEKEKTIKLKGQSKKRNKKQYKQTNIKVSL